jgi:hypothetical protein
VIYSMCCYPNLESDMCFSIQKFVLMKLGIIESAKTAEFCYDILHRFV